MIEVDKMDKVHICKVIRTHLESKMQLLQDAIDSAKESRDSETKSSAGDKYETGRAMVQAEIDRYEQQLAQLIEQEKVLRSIDPVKKQDVVEVGSLVKCSNGVYFISVAIGKVEFGEGELFAISLASPIGQALQGKKAGEEVDFQGRSIRILNIE